MNATVAPRRRAFYIFEEQTVENAAAGREQDYRP